MTCLVSPIYRLKPGELSPAARRARVAAAQREALAQRIAIIDLERMDDITGRLVEQAVRQQMEAA